MSFGKPLVSSSPSQISYLPHTNPDLSYPKPSQATNALFSLHVSSASGLKPNGLTRPFPPEGRSFWSCCSEFRVEVEWRSKDPGLLHTPAETEAPHQSLFSGTQSWDLPEGLQPCLAGVPEMEDSAKIAVFTTHFPWGLDLGQVL